MTFKTYEINIDLVNEASTTSTIHFSTNDRNAAKLLLTITNKGAELDLSQAKSVRISFKKPDGTRVFQNDCLPINVLKGKYQIVLNTQTLAVEGYVYAQVHIEEEDRTIDTQKFFFVVNESLSSDEAFESTNAFGFMQKYVEASEKLEGVDIDALITSKETAESALAKSTENTNQIEILSSNVTSNTTQLSGKAEKSYVDTELAKKATQTDLTVKADKTYVDTKVSAVASGAPKGVYETLTALQTAKPTGDSGVYLVTADGKWYYWNGSSWTIGGAYQSAGIADNSIKTNHYAETSVTENKMDISDFIFKRYVVDGYFDSAASGSLNFPSFIFDLGSSRVVSSVKFKVEFIYISSEVPTKMPIRLFANNSSSRTDLTGYGSPYFYPISVPEANKKYSLEIQFPMTDAEGDKISSFRYLKGYVGFDGKAGWTNKVSHVRFTKAVLEVDGIEHDVIKTVEDFGTGLATVININDNQRRFAFKDELYKETKPFEGQVFNSLGDSITYGYDPNNSGAQMLRPWVKQVGDQLGFSTVSNYGISGTSVATKTSDPNWNTARKPMVLRYQDMVDADVISCLGGINDFWLGVPLGTFDSRDTDTFYGALHTLYKGLAERYPTKKLFVMTCLYYKGTNPNGVTLDQWVEAQRQVAIYYSIPLFDLYKYSGLSWRVEAQKPLIPDGLHPSQSGADIMARKIANFIKTL